MCVPPPSNPQPHQSSSLSMNLVVTRSGPFGSHLREVGANRRQLVEFRAHGHAAAGQAVVAVVPAAERAGVGGWRAKAAVLYA